MNDDMIERLKKLHAEKGVKQSFVACRIADRFPDADKTWNGRGKLHKERCEICDREIWATDNTLKMREGLGSNLYCDDCTRLASASDESVTVMTKEAIDAWKKDTGATDEQVQEHIQKWQKIHGTKHVGGVV